MGRSRHEQLDRLIDEVARGERELRSIADAREREAVRIALRLHTEAAAQPDAYARIRMRAHVLGRLDVRRATLRDHAWSALEVVARPAPYIVRGIAIAVVLFCVGMGAMVASADSLPDDALYPVKLGSEAVRLALAASPADRAVIETSVAEHRLREAERLATSGRVTDALVASAMYSRNMAWAAADLAPSATSDLARQLESRFDADRARAQTLATSLSTNATSAGGARVLELIAKPAPFSGDTGVVRVASTAAGVAEQLVQAAEETAAGPTLVPSTAAANTTDAATARPRGTATSSDAARPGSQKATEALRTLKRAAEETRAAAERAKSRGSARRD